MIDQYGTLISRWMGNGLVLFISKIYRVGSIVNYIREKMTNKNNKKHVESVWGKLGAVEVFIPTLIDNYNYWMGGVDLADQRIAYYHPNLRCRRNWIPMFIQLLSMIRNNAYIVHREHFSNKKRGVHKKFTIDMIAE